MLLLAAATGLMIALRLAERRRTFGILTALGATGSQVRAFLWSEGLATLIGGSVIGLAMGFGVAWMLVKMLTGVFDPPPASLSVPWLYLVILISAAAVSTIIAVLFAYAHSHHSGIAAMREN
jgi:putative ABC transport system permease protein